LRNNAAVHHSKHCALMSQMGQTRSWGPCRLDVRFAQKRTRLGDFMSTRPSLTPLADRKIAHRCAAQRDRAPIAAAFEACGGRAVAVLR